MNRLETRIAPWRLSAAAAALAAALAALTAASTAALAEDSETMMADCKVRAARTFRVGVGAITVKYEGQRVDGTHAVNGTAQVRGAEGTFQCSFDRSARRIVRFVGNMPPGGRPGGPGDTGHRES
ncbi:MAG: hypothetical protein ACRCTI_21135, partial [Beijerinckiaceae bacterium]